MPDIKDAKRQTHDALTEDGALPQWDPVTWRSNTNEPDTWRLRIPGGWLYSHGTAIVFVPYVAGDAELRASDQAAENAYELMRAAENERDEFKRLLQLTQERLQESLAEATGLRNARLTAEAERDAARAAADEWAAIARDMAGKPPAPTAEPCPRRAPANVGPSSFTMRGCRLAEGHAGPCEA